ncbi:hypothetical protein CMUS01_04007 [Colletotrichum musicola]|uniref:Uncharacterized protein n=1 Tax=Colletotrichum musicola TaxID=2175873 RepID=A0A8H6U4W5_9PEZI|nr:hypothetical protein CMUS01_04007 [Colletotrichum musicola]
MPAGTAGHVDRPGQCGGHRLAARPAPLPSPPATATMREGARHLISCPAFVGVDMSRGMSPTIQPIYRRSPRRIHLFSQQAGQYYRTGTRLPHRELRAKKVAPGCAVGCRNVQKNPSNEELRRA